MSISSVSSARRARSQPSCNASAARDMRSTARPRAACSRCRATSWSSARRCSTASSAASSTGSRSPSSRSMCWRSRSSPKSRRGNGRRTSSSRCSAAPGPIGRWPREDFAAVVAMLAEGFATRRGRRGALLHHDAVNHMLRGRRGARLTALTSGGAIPDTADYQVLLEPENQVIGSVNEDWAVESMAGDVFQLGNTRLPHPARRARHRAGRGRAGHDAQHPVLARRGAGPHRRAVAIGVAACGGNCRAVGG